MEVANAAVATAAPATAAVDAATTVDAGHKGTGATEGVAVDTEAASARTPKVSTVAGGRFSSSSSSSSSIASGTSYAAHHINTDSKRNLETLHVRIYRQCVYAP